MKKMEVWFFKENGTFYATEIIEVPIKLTLLCEINDYIKEKCKDMYKGKYCVIPFNNCDDIHGCPHMIPINER